MSSLMISYARIDQATVQKLVDQLIRAGFSIWWDRSLEGGQDWRQTIEQNIDAADAVVVIWSAASRQSAYVIDEAMIALNRAKLIPVNIDGCQPPLGFGTIHAIPLAILVDDVEPLMSAILSQTIKVVDPATANAPAMPCDAAVAIIDDEQNPVGHIGVDDIVNIDEAIKLCRHAITQYPKVARFRAQLGRALVQAAQYEQGRVALEKAASFGSGSAMLQLCNLHFSGQPWHGHLPDEKKYWFWRDAARRHYKSLTGDLSKHGYFVLGKYLVDNDADKKECLQLASDAGHAAAADALGHLFAFRRHESDDIELLDKETALKYYELAIQRGYSKSYLSAALLLNDDTISGSCPVRAIDYTIRAAELGKHDCWSRAAELCLHRKIRLDQVEGLFLRGIAAGDEDATLDIANYYEFHCNLDQEAAHKKIVEHYVSAADRGNTWAMHSLFRLYLEGRVVSQDLVKAEAWLSEAAERGNVSSMISLAEKLRDGVFGKKDITAAARWFKAAAAGQRVWAGDAPLLSLARMLDTEGRFEKDKVGEYIINILVSDNYSAAAQIRIFSFNNNFSDWSKLTRVSLQKYLRDRGYYAGPIDGNWTVDCTQALRVLMAAHGKTSLD